MSLRVAVNPDLLAWALEHSGLTASALRDEFSEVDAWLNGSRQPLLKDLEAFAKAVNAPFGALFLPEPPEHWPTPEVLREADSAIVMVDDEGGVVVPMGLWASLGVAAGSHVRFEFDGEVLRVTPVSDDPVSSPERGTVERGN